MTGVVLSLWPIEREGVGLVAVVQEVGRINLIRGLVNVGIKGVENLMLRIPHYRQSGDGGCVGGSWQSFGMSSCLILVIGLANVS